MAGQFKLCPIHCPDGRTGYDLTREVDPTNPDNFAPYIYDARNDENQLILQIHILIQRFHNRLIKNGVFKKGPTEHVRDFIRPLAKVRFVGLSIREIIGFCIRSIRLSQEVYSQSPRGSRRYVAKFRPQRIYACDH